MRITKSLDGTSINNNSARLYPHARSPQAAPEAPAAAVTEAAEAVRV